jgi:Uma2 family endonuclease
MVAISNNRIDSVEMKEKRYTINEYLRFEEHSMERHEFHNGKIIKMGNTKFYHNLVATNTSVALRIATKPLSRTILIVGDGQKIYIKPADKIVYPDGLAVVEKPEFEGKSQVLIINPLLIIEVLSPRTEKYDESGKYKLYQMLPSFKEYMLIDPRKFSIETRFKDENGVWKTVTQTDANGSIALHSLGISVLLADIYQDVVFPKKKKL